MRREEQVSGDKYNAQLVKSGGDYPVFPAAAEYQQYDVALFQSETLEIVAGLIGEL
jgi:hypothetical protein